MLKNERRKHHGSTKALTDLKLQINVLDGTTASGKAKSKNLNFSNIKLDASDEQLMAAGKAICGLTAYTLNGLRRIDTNDLSE